MKKLLTIILVLTLVLGLTSVASATPNGNGNGEVVYTDDSFVTINKDVAIVNDGTVNPAETFNFTVGDGEGLRDGVTITAPEFDPDEFSIALDQGVTAGSSNIILPDFDQVGVYTYPITEVKPTVETAGMFYDADPKDLVITVINNPAYDSEEEDSQEFLRVVTMTSRDEEDNPIKVDVVQNTFSAGNLTINKVITGNYADPNDEFTITVTVTPDTGKVIKPGPIVWNTTNVTESGGAYTATYTLTGGDNNTVTIQNLPYNVSYTVVETQYAGYDAPVYDDNATGAFSAASIETTITNNRYMEIATGINLDSLPYLIILAVAIGGLFLFVTRRRMASNE